MDLFYLVVIIAFATLCVLTLFNHLIRGNEVREATADNRVQLERAKERMTGFQTELEELRADSKLLNDKRVALDAQGKCMINLLESYEAEIEAK